MDPSGPPRRVSFREAFLTWCRVACLSFGGPAGQIAVMHRILVEEKKWLSEQRFLHALNYCMLLPGPEAQQLATYTGWLLHRTLGGLVAGTLFVLPGFVSILALSIIYAYYQQAAIVQALFFGLKPAVLAIVVEALLRIGRRVLTSGAKVALAALAFVGSFFFNVPLPLLIVAVGAVGFVGGRLFPAHFSPAGQAAPSDASLAEEVVLHAVRPTLWRSVYVTAIGLALWFAPVAAARMLWGPSSVYFQQGVFFSQAAVVTFGGAYSVLAYVAQQGVEHFGWLKPGEMLDGLGMAETTPGPLIQVVQFVGFLGAFRQPAPFSPLAAGILGSILTAWVTFVPCFLWILLGAPYIERLRGNRALNATLSAITAAVVGVILNLAVWLALHTLFAAVTVRPLGGLRLLVPELNSINPAACAVAVLAFWLTFYRKVGMTFTLAISAAAGMALYFATGR